MALYLHETIHTVPGQEEAYIAGVMATRFAEVLTEPEGTIRQIQVGLFRTSGSSGVWPKVINLWDIVDWRLLTNNFKLQFTDTRDPYLEDWWNRNLTLRRGGFDRVLVPATFTPDVDQLRAEGVQARVFLQEIVRVSFGGAREYLGRLEELFLPIAVENGWQLVGAYSVALRPAEVVTLWGLESWAELGALAAGAGRAPRLGEWLDYRARVVTRSEEMALLPGRVNPLGRFD
jgi:hypothetical protein